MISHNSLKTLSLSAITNQRLEKLFPGHTETKKIATENLIKNCNSISFVKWLGLEQSFGSVAF